MKTPLIYDAETFFISGTPEVRDLMFKLDVDGQPWAMKAMNCPGHMLLFGSKLRSYRELPVRFAEPAPLHRNELAGTLHGLPRVRHDARRTSSVTPDQIQDEIAVVDYGRYLSMFGLTASASSPRGPRTSSAATRSGT